MKLTNAILILSLSFSVAKADTIYTFSGSTTENPSINPPGCSVDAPCSLSGFIDMAGPLSPDMALELIAPDSWSFIFPHRAGFDFSTNPSPNDSFYLATDAQGNISQWSIHLDDQYWNEGPDTLTFSGTPIASTVHVFDWSDDACFGCDNFNLSGGWQDPPAVAPEPGSLVLMGSGIIMLLIHNGGKHGRRIKSNL